MTEETESKLATVEHILTMVLAAQTATLTALSTLTDQVEGASGLAEELMVMARMSRDFMVRSAQAGLAI